MHNQSYDEYIRSILGYPIQSGENSFYRDDSYYNDDNYMYEDIEKFYPEIYKIVYPMVKNSCNKNTREISSEIIEQLTEEIYSNIETTEVANVEKNEIASNLKSQVNSENTRNRPRNNFLLRDLIRILLIRELTKFPPRRPPFGPPPKRSDMYRMHYNLY